MRPFVLIEMSRLNQCTFQAGKCADCVVSLMRFGDGRAKVFEILVHYHKTSHVVAIIQVVNG